MVAREGTRSPRRGDCHPAACSSPRDARQVVLSLTAALSLIAGVHRSTIGTEPSASAPAVTARLQAGIAITGSIQSLTPDTLTLALEGQTREFPRNDLISLDIADSADQPNADAWLLLSNGDRAPLVPIDIIDDALVCRWATAPNRPNCRVPLEFVSGILRRPLTLTADSTLLPELSTRAFSEDTLILSDGTRLTGALEGVSADSFRVETAVGPVAIDATRVVAVAMNAALVQRPATSESAALVTLRDGSWLTLHDLTLGDSGRISGRTAFAAEFHGALADVVRIATYGPRAVDLTTRNPTATTAVPFVARTPQLLVNRNVRGGFLKVEGREHPHGFGMTSGMSATFPLEPADRQFQASVGLDDVVGEAGSVTFAVDLDGRRIFTSPVLSGRDALLAIEPLDIAGGMQLTLSVEFAEYGNVQDVADWCDPLLLR